MIPDGGAKAPMHFWEKTELFFFTFYQLFAALISFSIIVFFIAFHWRHVRIYKKLFSRLKRKDITLIFGSEKFVNHKDREIARMARNCRSLMVHQIILATAFAVIYGLLTTLRYHIFT